MLDHELSGKCSELAIGGPANHRNWRDDANGVTGHEAVHAFPDPFDNAGRLEPKAGR